MSETKRLRSVVRGCLRRIHDDFTGIELRGEGTRVIDRSVDFSTKADSIISRTIRAYFDSLPESYVVFSEEREHDTDHGATRAVIADEIDGTANLIGGGGLPFGPVIAIAPDPDPLFTDITAVGFLSIPTGDLYEAYRGAGASVVTGWIGGRNDTQLLSTSGRTRLSAEPPPNVLVDQYMLGDRPELARTLWTMGYPGDFRSWAYHTAAVARGSYDLAITGDHCALNDAKRATAEELAGGYLLIREAGGHVTTWNGGRLDSKRIGMADTATFDVVAAASEELAVAASKRIRETIE